MRFSILHVSDLHRDLADEIENVTLLDSLERDIAKWAGGAPPILAPSLCIVTGDIVYGVSATAATPKEELARQYAQALDFLVGLANRLYNGARDRVVILPGNHDISMTAVAASMDRVEIPTAADSRARLVEEFFAPRSRLRWSWQDLCFFRIVNEQDYRNRLQDFANLYSSFYEGRRTFSLDPECQHDAFDFADLGFCVLMLNSCFENDPFRRAGRFHPAVITEACKLARAPTQAGRLIAAAWHHNVTGGPAQDNYLESGVLQLFIDSGISVAFHGHQHFSECLEERYRLGPDPGKITLIGAGTLCAGPHVLPPGEPRSFNIVELDTEAWTGRLHHRRMVNRDHNLPTWGPGHFNSTNSSFIDFKVGEPRQARPLGLDVRLAIERAERLLGARSWTEAIRVLQPHRTTPLARPLLASALSEAGDLRQMIDVLSPPTTIAEAVLIGGAIYEAGTRAEAEAFLAEDFVASESDASVREIVRRVRERRAQ